MNKCKKKNKNAELSRKTDTLYARQFCINRIAEEIFRLVEIELILFAILGTGQWLKFLSAK